MFVQIQSVHYLVLAVSLDLLSVCYGNGQTENDRRGNGRQTYYTGRDTHMQLYFVGFATFKPFGFLFINYLPFFGGDGDTEGPGPAGLGGVAAAVLAAGEG